MALLEAEKVLQQLIAGLIQPKSGFANLDGFFGTQGFDMVCMCSEVPQSIHHR